MASFKKFNAIDLFAGCGGLSDGFELSGHFESLACVEWEIEPCNTLMKRLKDKYGYKNLSDIVFRFDIQRTDELFNGWSDDVIYGQHKGLDAVIGNKSVDIVIGGPPCQAYSVAGRIRDVNGMHDDYRNYLFESYVKVVDRYRPKVFVFENVQGLLSAKPGGISIVDRITKAFKDIGYTISQDLKKDALFNCADFGVPQQRKRLIIIGVDDRQLKGSSEEAIKAFYKKLNSQKRSGGKTVADAIQDLPKFYPTEDVVKKGGKKTRHIGNTNVENHIPRLHSKRDIETFRLLADDILSGRMQYLSAESLKQLYFELTGKQSNIHKYHVLQWDKPSNTIPAHLYKDGLRHIHPDPDQARSITVREAARLQTFDDDYVFTGSMTDQYKMIGNAVPPKLSNIIAETLIDFMREFC
ncbi:DNA cytosine methyltransferase [Sphingobacterium sp. LRF_L2]|uniref:DNA cytosine methyltransferase n=1 Tax=Sphingobacterium sp. LRF_L2 TaxID=3369421 RepID=UPI003F5D5DC4